VMKKPCIVSISIMNMLSSIKMDGIAADPTSRRLISVDIRHEEFRKMFGNRHELHKLHLRSGKLNKNAIFLLF
jgi:hypothetical protein